MEDLSTNNFDISQNPLGNADYWERLRSVTDTLTVPCLLIGATLNQQEWSTELLAMGRLISSLSILLAITIIWSHSREKYWPVVFISGLLISKMGRIACGNDSIFATTYTVFYALLFCVAGAIIASQRPRLIYRQVLYFCAVSAPLMLLQLTGAGEWTQILRTDYHGIDSIVQHPTLFMGRDVVITTLQARPAGFVWANNFLSIIIMFGLGLHFGHIQSNKLTWEDVTLCAIAVLAMAKIVFLAFFVICLWLLVLGDSVRRNKIAKVIILFSFLMTAYAIFFPGVFSYNTSFDLLQKNFGGRHSDLTLALRTSIQSENHEEASVEPMARSAENSSFPGTKDPGASPHESDAAVKPATPRESIRESVSRKAVASPPAMGAEKENTVLSTMVKSAVPGREIKDEKEVQPGVFARVGKSVFSEDSGYAQIAEKGFPFLVISVFFLVPFYTNGFNKLKTRSSISMDIVVLSMFVVLLIPLVTSFMEGAVFWFVAGFAFLPLLLHAGLVQSCSELSDLNRIA